jgi:hypothetical protein
MGTYPYFDNSELWEHIQSELWHLSFGIMGSFRQKWKSRIASREMRIVKKD